MTWPYDGALCAPGDIRARLEALVDPWQRLRVRMVWLFSNYMQGSAGSR